MTSREIPRVPSSPGSGLARHLGLFGTTMAVMGGIIGAGIFINPYLVAERVHTSFLILSVWIAGGVVALLGGLSMPNSPRACPSLAASTLICGKRFIRAWRFSMAGSCFW